MFYIYIREGREKEPEIIKAPFKIEVYRVDRYPLPKADIYLNQRFIGKTDERGFFFKDIELMVGESYTLRIERERGGYVYGPWETNFKVKEEKKRRREKKKEEIEEISSLEGESDILTEIERAQLGKASLYEKYHFLAFIEGYMFYQIKVAGKNESAVENATVIVNSKVEGKTDKNGISIVKYSGEDKRKEDIQIFKEGEHIWMNEVMIQPDAKVSVELNKMLLIDLNVYSEYYDVIKGVENAEIYLGQEYMGMTDGDGHLSFKYINESGVDGYLNLLIDFPSGFIPGRLRRSFYIKEDLPKLKVINFTYNKNPVSPKVVLMPFTVKSKNNYFLAKQAAALKTRIEDYLSSEDVFTVSSSKMVQELFRQFNIDFKVKNYTWQDMPLIKKEVDGVILGEISESNNIINVKLYGFDYTGEKFLEINKMVSLRELQSLSEDIASRIKNSFPFEGNIVSVKKNIYVNLGKRHGIKQNNKFYGFIDYFDELTKNYSKKRVIKLKIVDTGEILSAGELEDINEGYLLEPGVKVRRYRALSAEKIDIPVIIKVAANKEPVPDANVYLDDRWSGQTDDEGKLYLTLLSNENVDLLVYKEGYVPGKLSVKAGEETNVVRINLKRGETVFRVASKPEGALLFINEIFKGTTPITDKPLVVPYGFHLVELELEGYKKYRNYINFKERKLSLIGKESIALFPDYFGAAEEMYAEGHIERTIAFLRYIPLDHPDYNKAMEFLGYVYLNDLKDYRKSIEYYERALNTVEGEYRVMVSLISNYNLAQAHYNAADQEFYVNRSSAQYNFMKAVYYFNYIRVRRNRIPGSKRNIVYQDTLFYLAVSYQKLYYLTQKGEYLSRTRFSWIDYFDFFNEELLKDDYFKKQYSIADSYRKEAERLKGE